MNFIDINDIDRAVAAIRKRTDFAPDIALVLGSGLGGLANSVSEATVIPYDEIPGWPTATVEGHEGKLILGTLEGVKVCVQQGRAHHYEGYSMGEVGFPVRVMTRLGIGAYVVTNAAGGVNQEFSTGDVMLIADHINFQGMAGHSPLFGPNIDELGPRFPDMSRAYDREYMGIARRVADGLGIQLQEGVYICLGGPTFESPAELKLLHTIGADAVGMSTVPEVTVARHGGLRVLGFSGITNKWDFEGNTSATHEEVLEAGREIGPKLKSLIRGVLPEL